MSYVSASKQGKVGFFLPLYLFLIFFSLFLRYTQFDVSEFQQIEDNGSSHVDLTYSTDISINIANMMDVRTRIHDRQMPQQVKVDLVEHVWRKFRRDEDDN